MNRSEKVYKKIIFVEEYWKSVLNGNIDLFSQQNLIDLSIILNDILITIQNIIKSNRKENIIWLQELRQEFQRFYPTSYFYSIKPFKELILSIDIELSSLFSENKKGYLKRQDISNLNNFKMKLEKIIKQLKEQNRFYEIMYRIMKICLDNISIKKCSQQLKGYVNEAIIQGYTFKMSEEYMTDFFKSHVKISNFLKKDEEPESEDVEGIKEFINKCSIKLMQEVTYIFSIKNMYLVSPIRWEDIIFYNPMRKDLLVYFAKESWLEEDYYLLTREQQEFMKENRLDEDGCVTGEEYSTVLETDCHARVKIMAISGVEGVDRAKEYVNDKLKVIKTLVKGRGGDLVCAKEYQYIEECPSEYKSYTTSIDNRNLSFESLYTVRDFEDMFKESIKDKNSPLIKINNLNNKKVINTGIEWYNKAINEKNKVMEFIYLVICIEVFITEITEERSIKSTLKKVLPKVMIIDMLDAQIEWIYRSVRGQYRDFFIAKEVPKEILEIKGLEEFVNKVDKRAFITNLSIIKKYTKSPYVLSIIEEIDRVYHSLKYQDKLINDLEKKIKWALNRTYNLRSDLVHSGKTNEYLIDLNINLVLRGAVSLMDKVLKEVKFGDTDEDIKGKLNIHKIEKEFKIWKSHLKI